MRSTCAAWSPTLKISNLRKQNNHWGWNLFFLHDLFLQNPSSFSQAGRCALEGLMLSYGHAREKSQIQTRSNEQIQILHSGSNHNKWQTSLAGFLFFERSSSEDDSESSLLDFWRSLSSARSRSLALSLSLSRSLALSRSRRSRSRRCSRSRRSRSRRSLSRLQKNKHVWIDWVVQLKKDIKLQMNLFISSIKKVVPAAHNYSSCLPHSLTFSFSFSFPFPLTPFTRPPPFTRTRPRSTRPSTIPRSRSWASPVSGAGPPSITGSWATPVPWLWSVSRIFTFIVIFRIGWIFFCICSILPFILQKNIEGYIFDKW